MLHINTEFLLVQLSRTNFIDNFPLRFQQTAEAQSVDAKFLPTPALLEWARKINERELANAERAGFKRRHLEDKRMGWVFGEFKFFGWVLVLQCALQGKGLGELSDDAILEVKQVFSTKSVSFVKYELQAMLVGLGRREGRQWEEEELQLLARIVSRAEADVNWREISFLLYYESGHRYFKSIHKCKEKWMNYLNPTVNRLGWSLEEDYKLFQMVKEHGQKWAFISTEMGHTRTEHMVKNRYHWHCKRFKGKKEVQIVGIVYNQIKLKLTEERKKKREEEERIERRKQEESLKQESAELNAVKEEVSNQVEKSETIENQGIKVEENEPIPDQMERPLEAPQNNPQVKQEQFQLHPMHSNPDYYYPFLNFISPFQHNYMPKPKYDFY